MLAKFVKKPVEIEAIQWQPDAIISDQWFIDAVLANRIVMIDDDSRLAIGTLEGMMTAETGDWILRGVKGEIYPCKPDIFEMTYTPLIDLTSGTS